LLTRGELCRGCGKQCVDQPSESNVLEIADETDPLGTWRLAQCPRRFVADIVDEINMAQLADQHLPVEGGVMDQAAWWVNCWLAFKSDCSQIDQDKLDRERGRYV
jgi:hypothetical protein